MDLKQLILIRHGELPPEYAGRFVGSTDAPLGEKGMEDCRALAGIWKEMNSEVTFVSPKLRARQTAELVCGDGEIQLDDARLTSAAGRPSISRRSPAATPNTASTGMTIRRRSISRKGSPFRIFMPAWRRSRRCC